MDLSRLRHGLQRLWSLLWIDYDRLDEEFRVELRERGLLGLRVVSAAAVVLIVFAVAVLWPFGPPDYPRGGGLVHIGLAEEAGVAALGVLGLALSRAAWGARHARGLTAVIGLLLGVLLMIDMVNSGGYASSVYSIAVMLVLLMVVAVPLRPLSVGGFGLAVTGMFAVSALFDASVGWPPPVSWIERLVLLFAVSVLGGGLSVMLTRLHIGEHESRARLAESFEALRRTQAQLIESKRAASQGRLAAALSHEINTPLSVLLSGLRLIERRLSEVEGCCADPEAVVQSVGDAKAAAQRSREALSRLSQLVQRFERFTHVDTAARGPVDVNELLDDAVAVLSGGWGGRIEVVKDFDEVPPVLAFPTRLSEVFGNVLSNAAGAIEGEGVIRISTRYGRGFVWIQISDTGHGIEPEAMSRIFDPAFRVDGGRVRTGWGLFISRQIVHDHDGEFRISSEPQRGTAVEICLPAGAAEPAE